MFIAYTIKGFGLPFAGHKDNHAGLMNPTQIAALRDQFGIAEGGEWEPYGGLGDNAAARLQAFVERSPLGSLRREPEAAHVTVPISKVPEGAEQSTHHPFGPLLLVLEKSQ